MTGHAHTNYDFTIAKAKGTHQKITIDPSGLMADVKQEISQHKRFKLKYKMSVTYNELTKSIDIKDGLKSYFF
jgi:hypothetical protein